MWEAFRVSSGEPICLYLLHPLFGNCVAFSDAVPVAFFLQASSAFRINFRCWHCIKLWYLQFGLLRKSRQHHLRRLFEYELPLIFITFLGFGCCCSGILNTGRGSLDYSGTAILQALLFAVSFLVCSVLVVVVTCDCPVAMSSGPLPLSLVNTGCSSVYWDTASCTTCSLSARQIAPFSIGTCYNFLFLSAKYRICFLVPLYISFGSSASPCLYILSVRVFYSLDCAGQILWGSAVHQGLSRHCLVLCLHWNFRFTALTTPFPCLHFP